MTRREALDLVCSRIPQVNIVKHARAVEAIMSALAVRLGGDREMWGLTGLLHDLDYAETLNDPARHARLTCEILAGRLPPEALHAILAHNRHVQAESPLDWALLAADPASGFIVAAALMHPSRTLAALDVAFLERRFGEKRFAAGASREQMLECRRLGLERHEFLGLALSAMQAVSSDLGL